MGYRKQRFAALFCAAAVIMLGGCGDDLTQQVYIPGREDLAQPIGGYNATTQAGQTAEDSATGAQTGTASGGENATTSGFCHDSGGLTGERYTITISAAGDVTLGNHQEQDYSASFRQAYDQAEDEGYFFENVRDIFAADDMTIVNLEGPLTTSEQMREGQTYCIKGDPAYAHLLTLGSIEAVSFANNHRLDYGEQGSRDTVVALEKEGIIYAYDKNVVALHTAGVQVVAALHLNIARDFQIGITLNTALIGAADHIVQTAGRRRVDIAAGGNHYISAVHCGFVAAAVECFA